MEQQAKNDIKIINKMMMDEQINQQAQDQVDQNLPQPTITHKISQFEQLHLKYSYSGLSNASSSNDFMLTTTRSFNEDFIKLNFIQSSQLYSNISNRVQQLKKRMLIHHDLILYLLYVHKWNQQKLNDVYYDKYVEEYQRLDMMIQKCQKQRQEADKIHDDEGFVESQQEKKSTKIQQNNYKGASKTCEVCLSQNVRLYPAYFCQHSYCRQCWLNYIHQSLTQGKIFFPACLQEECPSSKYPVLPHFLKSLDLLNNQLIELYKKKLCVNYAIINKSVSYCPSQSCNLFCEKSIMTCQSQLSQIQCPCGTVYCFRCEKQPHQPVTCEEIKKWDELTNEDKTNQLWIKKYTRKCPQCQQPVQKYVGCNHIKCLCNQEFCFSCLGKWDQKHKLDGQICNKEKKLRMAEQIKQNQHVEGKQTIQEQKSMQPEQGTLLEKLHDKVIYISRCINKNIDLVNRAQKIISSFEPLYYMKQQLHEVRHSIRHSWSSIKYTIISLYLKGKPQIQDQIQKDSIASIQNLMQTVQRIYQILHSYNQTINLQHFGLIHHQYYDTKELIYLKEQLFKRKQTMIKTINVWNQAARDGNQ